MMPISGKRSPLVISVAISVLATLIIGSLVYYTLKRHDGGGMAGAGRPANDFSEANAVALGRLLAAAATPAMVSDASRAQELTAAIQRRDDIRDVMLVGRDGQVLAAKDPGQVGQRLTDAAWEAWKQTRGVAQWAVDRTGRPVFVVVEPLADKSDVFAWAMLVFAPPQPEGAPTIPADRLMEAGRLMAAIFLVVLITIRLSMEVAGAVIRKQIQGVMADVLQDPDDAVEPSHWLRKVS